MNYSSAFINYRLTAIDSIAGGTAATKDVSANTMD